MQSNKVESMDEILDPRMIEVMDRKELQAHCKKFGYQANLKNKKLKEMLLHRTMRQIGISIDEGKYYVTDTPQRSFKWYGEQQSSTEGSKYDTPSSAFSSFSSSSTLPTTAATTTTHDNYNEEISNEIELNEASKDYLTLGETIKEIEPAPELLTIDAKEYLSLSEEIKEIETAPTLLPIIDEALPKSIRTNDNDAEHTETADNNDENGYNNNDKTVNNDIATTTIDPLLSSNKDSDVNSRQVTMVDIENKFTELYGVVIQEDLHKLTQFNKKIHQDDTTTNTSVNNVNSVDHVAAIRPTKRKKTEPIGSTSTSLKKKRITITRTKTKTISKQPVAKRNGAVKADEQRKKEEFLQRREAAKNVRQPVLEKSKKAKKHQLDHNPPSRKKRIKD